MADNPNSFMSQFFEIPVSTVRGDTEFITVRKYLSTSTNRKGNKKEVWTHLQNFLRFAKNDETGEPFQQGEWIVDPRLQPHGRVQYSWTKTLGPFNGKGLPERYQKFLHIVDLWLTVGCEGRYRNSYRPDTWTRTLSLQEFADDYMGVDCNCFVGGFFQANYPATGWGVEVDWTKGALMSGPQRKSIDEVKPLDVLVRYKGKSDKHVAVIDDVWSKTGSQATIFLSQSAGSKSGLWGGVCTLSIDSKGSAKTIGGYSVEFDEGVFGVIGANC